MLLTLQNVMNTIIMYSLKSLLLLTGVVDVVSMYCVPVLGIQS